MLSSLMVMGDVKVVGRPIMDAIPAITMNKNRWLNVLFVLEGSFLLDQFVVMKHLVCRMELVDVKVVRKVVPLVVMMVESLVVLSAP